MPFKRTWPVLVCESQAYDAGIPHPRTSQRGRRTEPGVCQPRHPPVATLLRPWPARPTRSHAPTTSSRASTEGSRLLKPLKKSHLETRFVFPANRLEQLCPRASDDPFVGHIFEVRAFFKDCEVGEGATKPPVQAGAAPPGHAGSFPRPAGRTRENQTETRGTHSLCLTPRAPDGGVSVLSAPKQPPAPAGVGQGLSARLPPKAWCQLDSRPRPRPGLRARPGLEARERQQIRVSLPLYRPRFPSLEMKK